MDKLENVTPITVNTLSSQKAEFVALAKANRRSLSAWMLIAAEEKAARVQAEKEAKS